MSDFEIRIERIKHYKSPLLYYDLQHVYDKYYQPHMIDKLQTSHQFIDQYLTNQFHDNEELKTYVAACVLEDYIKTKKCKQIFYSTNIIETIKILLIIGIPFIIGIYLLFIILTHL